MGFLNLPIIFLFILSFHSFFFFFVKSDNPLIKSLCDKTDQPVICSDCLKSDSASTTANGRELAVISIKCAEKDTSLMAERLYDLYQNTNEPTLKNLLNECWLRVINAVGDFSGMARIVGEGDYQTGKEILGEVLTNVNSCLDGFNKFPDVPVPSVVLAGTLASDQECNVVLQILKNI